ncbi:hypothetical protein R3P38DRAFT_2777065 [Favolaschia claudopus]|uniref:Helicase ATP-binding domain-containing protein n=1 Tax=Favolaschia claudopus TaxID=2862362 RepID=A0AAW0BL64_9AGAR
MVQGMHTVLDVPTGGRKTLAFCTRKNLLVISPLARDLTKRGIPAVALVSQAAEHEQSLKDFGLKKFRVAFVSPELAVGEILPRACPQVGAIPTEQHKAVEEWGTDDFRPAYSELICIIPPISQFVCDQAIEKSLHRYLEIAYSGLHPGDLITTCAASRDARTSAAGAKHNEMNTEHAASDLEKIRIETAPPETT